MMNILDEIRNALKQQFNQNPISLDYDGKLLVITICDSAFKGLSPVKQQQMVYQIINPWILDKTIHAVKLNLSS